MTRAHPSCARKPNCTSSGLKEAAMDGQYLPARSRGWNESSRAAVTRIVADDMPVATARHTSSLFGQHPNRKGEATEQHERKLDAHVAPHGLRSALRRTGQRYERRLIDRCSACSRHPSQWGLRWSNHD
eukprot:scaffold207224_cov31-Tisochrysis_lutea.AAC.2